MNDLDTLLTHELCGSGDGRLLHRAPGGSHWYGTVMPDASPETTALIRRLDAVLEGDPA